MKIACAALCFLTSTLTLAAGSSEAAKAKIVVSPFQETYFHSIAVDSKKVTALREKVKKNDRSLCPGYLSKDVSSCLKQTLRVTTVSSATAATLLTDLASEAAKKDEARGFDGETCKLLMLDNLLTIIENLDPTKFAAEQLRPQSLSEKATRQHFIEVENEHLTKLMSSTLGLIEKKLPESGRTIASVAESSWKQDKQTELEDRLKRAKRYSLRLN